MGLSQTLSFIAHHPLSRGRRARNLSRFFAWQAVNRVWPAPVPFTLANGVKLYASRGLHGATGNLYVGLHEYETMAFCLHLLRAGDFFVDVGANVGSYTVLAAAGAGARVTAFEPGDAARGWLHRNIALNAISTLVTVDARALADTSGKAQFIASEDCMNRLASAGGATVDVTTLDDALGGDCPVLLKFDVEDGDAAFIRGATRTLSNPALLAAIGETWARGSVPALAQCGLMPVAYDPLNRSLMPLDADEAHRRNGGVFVRDIEDARKCLGAARPFVVRGREV